MDKELFEDIGYEIHKGAYSYKYVDVTDIHSDITLECELHGEFTITPNAHINYKLGCPYCREELRLKDLRASHMCKTKCKINKGLRMFGLGKLDLQ